MLIFHSDKKLTILSATRMLRHAQFISGFDYDVIHRSSNNYLNVNCFSRNLPSECESVNLVDSVYLLNENIKQISTETITSVIIIKETASDPELCKL